jgi:hypothetical protein
MHLLEYKILRKEINNNNFNNFNNFTKNYQYKIVN